MANTTVQFKNKKTDEDIFPQINNSKITAEYETVDNPSKVIKSETDVQAIANSVADLEYRISERIFEYKGCGEYDLRNSCVLLGNGGVTYKGKDSQWSSKKGLDVVIADIESRLRNLGG